MSQHNTLPRMPWWRRAWSRVKEPRVVSALAWVGYLVLALAAGYSLIDPPTVLTSIAGGVAARIMTGLVALGGAIGSVTALPGWWEMERTGIAMILGGVSIYIPGVLSAGLTSNQLMPAAFAFVVMVSMLSRWIRIRDRTLDPDSKAARRAVARHPEIKKAVRGTD